jgi:SAM-dependent methyltransferase
MTSQSEPSDDTYGRWFYEYVDESSATSAAAVVPVLDQLVHPASVVDVGCGTGGWLDEFVARGVDDVLGVDSDRVPPDLRKLDGARFVSADLTDPPDVGRRFDLALCLEVGEHLPEASATTLVDYLTSLAPVIVFSAAIPGQGGEDHINEQWPAYWATRFEKADYRLLDVLRPLFWDDERVDWFYRQNMVVYARSDLADRLDLPPGMARLPSPPLALVHPVAFAAVQERLDRWRSTPLSMSAHLRQLPAATVSAVRRRLNRGRD